MNGQKVGGNVASYFCLSDGSVIHAVPGPVNAAKFLTESRWAYETRKMAQAVSADYVTGTVDAKKFADRVKQSHLERFGTEVPMRWNQFTDKFDKLPASLPISASQQAQAHWLLAKEPLGKIGTISPKVWQHILGEKLSDVPVVKR